MKYDDNDDNLFSVTIRLAKSIPQGQAVPQSRYNDPYYRNTCGTCDDENLVNQFLVDMLVEFNLCLDSLLDWSLAVK